MLQLDQKARTLKVRVKHSAISSELVPNLNQPTKITFTAVISMRLTSLEGAKSDE